MVEAPDRKHLVWMGRSRKDIGEFPDRVKGELGHGLDLAQAGEKHENAKPLKGFKPSDIQQDIEFELSSGNVFADIGFDNAEEMLLKSELVRQINKTIKERELTSIQTSDLLNLSDEMLPNLNRGKLTELTLENLFRYLNVLGRDLEVVLKPRSTSSSQGKLQVTII